MLVKNNSVRLISIQEPFDKVTDPKTGDVISANGGAVYDLLPAGDAVSVPNSLCESKFVKALVQLGDISIAEDEDSDGVEGDEFELTKMTKAELVDFADKNGIEINSSAVKADVLAAITAAIED